MVMVTVFSHLQVAVDSDASVTPAAMQTMEAV